MNEYIDDSANGEKNTVICNLPLTPRPKTRSSYRKSSKCSVDDESDFDSSLVAVKRPRRNSVSCNDVDVKEPRDFTDFIETKSCPLDKCSSSTRRRNSEGRKSALVKIFSQDEGVEWTENTLASKENPTDDDDDDTPKTRRNLRSVNVILPTKDCSDSRLTEIPSNATKTPTLNDSSKVESSYVEGDIPRTRLHRKSIIGKCSADEGDTQPIEIEQAETETPTISETSQELPEWLQNELYDPSLKPLDTIFENFPLGGNRRVPSARSKTPNFSTPSRVVTRRSSLTKSPSPAPKETDSWSKICLPRQLIFVTMEELYPSDNDDENWKKLKEKSIKDKKRSLRSKLRAMKKRPGDVLRVSEETEKKLEKLLAEMEDD